LRGNGGGVDTRIRHLNRDTSFYDAHDHRIHRRRWRNAAVVCSEMGCRWKNCVGVDTHDSRRRNDCSDVVLVGEVAVSNVLDIQCRTEIPSHPQLLQRRFSRFPSMHVSSYSCAAIATAAT
jgi:hypothetical protein